MSFYHVELAPYSWFITHHLFLRGRRRRYVVQVEYLTPNFLTVSVQMREVLCRLT